MFDLGMVKYTGIWFIIPPWQKNRSWSIIPDYGISLDGRKKISQSRIYRNMVNLTLAKKYQFRFKIPEYDIVFKQGKKISWVCYLYNLCKIFSMYSLLLNLLCEPKKNHIGVIFTTGTTLLLDSTPHIFVHLWRNVKRIHFLCPAKYFFRFTS